MIPVVSLRLPRTIRFEAPHARLPLALPAGLLPARPAVRACCWQAFERRTHVYVDAPVLVECERLVRMTALDRKPGHDQLGLPRRDELAGCQRVAKHLRRRRNIEITVAQLQGRCRSGRRTARPLLPVRRRPRRAGRRCRLPLLRRRRRALPGCGRKCHRWPRHRYGGRGRARRRPPARRIRPAARGRRRQDRTPGGRAGGLSSARRRRVACKK